MQFRLKLSPIQFSCSRLQLFLELVDEKEVETYRQKSRYLHVGEWCGSLFLKSDEAVHVDDMKIIVDLVYGKGRRLLWSYGDLYSFTATHHGPVILGYGWTVNYFDHADGEFRELTMMLVVSPREKCFDVCRFCYVGKLGEIRASDKLLCEHAVDAIDYLLNTFAKRQNAADVHLTVAVGGHCDPALAMVRDGIYGSNETIRLLHLISTHIREIKEENQSMSFLHLTITTSFPDKLLDMMDSELPSTRLDGVAVSLKTPTVAEYTSALYTPREYADAISELLRKYARRVCLQFLCAIRDKPLTLLDAGFIAKVIFELPSRALWRMTILPLHYREVPGVTLRSMTREEVRSLLLDILGELKERGIEVLPSDFMLFDVCLLSHIHGYPYCPKALQRRLLWHYSVEKKLLYAPAPCPLGGNCTCKVENAG